MQLPHPIIVSELFPILLNELVSLLRNLSKKDWELPTACSSWSVKDVALHLLGGDIAFFLGDEMGIQHPIRLFLGITW